jgi:hypothetical protein
MSTHHFLGIAAEAATITTFIQAVATAFIRTGSSL